MATLLIDGNRGVYVPQQFAKCFPGAIQDAETLQILLAGPEHEQYWDAWQDVEDSEAPAAALGLDGPDMLMLRSDSGDLWAFNPEDESEPEFFL